MAAEEGVVVALSRGAHYMLESVHRKGCESLLHDANVLFFALAVDSMPIDLERDLRCQSRLLTVYP